MNPTPANPLGPGFTLQPITPAGGAFAGANPTLWQMALALLLLYFTMKYLPFGVWIGGLLLLGIFLSTPGGTASLCNILYFVQWGSTPPQGICR